jgi:oligoribonuclease (3'-5' exoribonuclease)
VLESAPDKPTNHRALDDVLASIDELRHYRAALFTPPDKGPE